MILRSLFFKCLSVRNTDLNIFRWNDIRVEIFFIPAKKERWGYINKIVKVLIITKAGMDALGLLTLQSLLPWQNILESGHVHLFLYWTVSFLRTHSVSCSPSSTQGRAHAKEAFAQQMMRYRFLSWLWWLYWNWLWPRPRAKGHKKCIQRELFFRRCKKQIKMPCTREEKLPQSVFLWLKCPCVRTLPGGYSGGDTYCSQKGKPANRSWQ